jgi:hypothetical protein
MLWRARPSLLAVHTGVCSPHFPMSQALVAHSAEVTYVAFILLESVWRGDSLQTVACVEYAYHQFANHDQG